MLIKYSCADLNTEEVRARKGQRDHISTACPHPKGNAVDEVGSPGEMEMVTDRLKTKTQGLGLTV